MQYYKLSNKYCGLIFFMQLQTSKREAGNKREHGLKLVQLQFDKNKTQEAKVSLLYLCYLDRTLK